VTDDDRLLTKARTTLPDSPGSRPPPSLDAATVPPRDDPTSPGRREPMPEPRPSEPVLRERYSTRSVLGEGGMGVVRLGHDAQIGRDVAIKSLRADRAARPDLRARFLREARVQGRLEHPSIVPVYEIGKDPDGTPYFAMKRIVGETLEDILIRLAKGHPETVAKYTRHRLLAAFGTVCLAIELAHERGVIHRDLKPGNVMFGNFGEVYVLDWGIAKVDGEGEIASAEADTLLAATRAGSYVGTLGFMSPEQLAGDEVDRRTDVYALGALLFQILTYEPLHVGNEAEITASTLTGAVGRPSERAPEREVPLELEALCLRAIASRRTDRIASARALYEELELYLDGDRERARRRELSDAYADAAAPRATAALEGRDPDNQAREQAMRDVGNALALDPGNRRALRTMTRLMVHPPRETPKDALAAMEDSRLELMRVTARMGAFVFSTWFLWMPLLVWMGIRDYVSCGVASLAFGGALTFCALEARKSHKPTDRMSAVILALGAVGFCALTRLFGPLVLLPTAVFGYALVFGQNHFRPRFGAFAFGLGVALLLVPTVLEYVGLIPRSYAFENGEMHIVPQMAGFPREGTLLFLGIANVIVMTSIWKLARRVQGALADAETRVAIQSWHLRLMVPEEARHAVRSPTVNQGRVELELLPSLGRVPAAPAPDTTKDE
jgi:serine/threonine protein kinase